MRISESFCKMRLSEYCTSQDVDRAIAVTVDSFVGGQKVSCKKALARVFAKYVSLISIPSVLLFLTSLIDTRLRSRARRGVRMVGMVSGLARRLRLSWLDCSNERLMELMHE